MSIESTGAGAHAPDPVKKLAEALAAIHGKARISMEASGYHIYIPCPGCLETHGEDELRDPKYAINASRYLESQLAAIPRMSPKKAFDPSGNRDQAQRDRSNDTRSSVCMRHGKVEGHQFPVSGLLHMSPLRTRHPDLSANNKVTGGGASEDKRTFWEPDARTGILCPPPAGRCIPVTELPAGHPCLLYIQSRQLDPVKLYNQFGCAFCEEEYPQSKEKHIFYKSLVDGWKDTPQGRLIFHCYHGGTPLSWQGRYLEMETAEGGMYFKWAWHPYRAEWVVTHTRSSVSQGWDPYGLYATPDRDHPHKLKWSPSKYRTAPHSSRELMGWDAALAATQDQGSLSWCVVCEGPADAARPGPGGLALMGKSISNENARKIASRFQLVFTAMDQDTYGQAVTDQIGKAIMDSRASNPKVLSVTPLQFTGRKDLGEMSDAEFAAIFQNHLRLAKRQCGH